MAARLVPSRKTFIAVGLVVALAAAVATVITFYVTSQLLDRALTECAQQTDDNPEDAVRAQWHWLPPRYVCVDDSG